MKKYASEKLNLHDDKNAEDEDGKKEASEASELSVASLESISDK